MSTNPHQLFQPQPQPHPVINKLDLAWDSCVVPIYNDLIAYLEKPDDSNLSELINHYLLTIKAFCRIVSLSEEFLLDASPKVYANYYYETIAEIEKDIHCLQAYFNEQDDFYVMFAKSKHCIRDWFSYTVSLRVLHNFAETVALPLETWLPDASTHPAQQEFSSTM